MRSMILSFILGLTPTACATTSLQNFCDIVDLKNATSFVGKRVNIVGEGLLYSDEGGTRAFLFSFCPVSFFEERFEKNVYVRLSDPENLEIVPGRSYSAEGILRKVSAPIYDGPAYLFVLDEPKIKAKYNRH